MIRKQFKYIITGLSFTVLLPPSLKDKFFEIIHISVTLKNKMKHVFIPLWVSCLDQYIYIWTINFTIPGWMFVPGKPHTKGN